MKRRSLASKRNITKKKKTFETYLQECMADYIVDLSTINCYVGSMSTSRSNLPLYHVHG